MEQGPQDLDRRPVFLITWGERAWPWEGVGSRAPAEPKPAPELSGAQRPKCERQHFYKSALSCRVRDKENASCLGEEGSFRKGLAAPGRPLGTASPWGGRGGGRAVLRGDGPGMVHPEGGHMAAVLCFGILWAESKPTEGWISQKAEEERSREGNRWWVFSWLLKQSQGQLLGSKGRSSVSHPTGYGVLQTNPRSGISPQGPVSKQGPAGSPGEGRAGTRGGGQTVRPAHSRDPLPWDATLRPHPRDSASPGELGGLVSRPRVCTRPGLACCRPPSCV